MITWQEIALIGIAATVLVVTTLAALHYHLRKMQYEMQLAAQLHGPALLGFISSTLGRNFYDFDVKSWPADAALKLALETINLKRQRQRYIFFFFLFLASIVGVITAFSIGATTRFIPLADVRALERALGLPSIPIRPDDNGTPGLPGTPIGPDDKGTHGLPSIPTASDDNGTLRLPDAPRSSDDERWRERFYILKYY